MGSNQKSLDEKISDLFEKIYSTPENKKHIETWNTIDVEFRQICSEFCKENNLNIRKEFSDSFYVIERSLIRNDIKDVVSTLSSCLGAIREYKS